MRYSKAIHGAVGEWLHKHHAKPTDNGDVECTLHDDELVKELNKAFSETLFGRNIGVAAAASFRKSAGLVPPGKRRKKSDQKVEGRSANTKRLQAIERALHYLDEHVAALEQELGMEPHRLVQVGGHALLHQTEWPPLEGPAPETPLSISGASPRKVRHLEKARRVYQENKENQAKK